MVLSFITPDRWQYYKTYRSGTTSSHSSPSLCPSTRRYCAPGCAQAGEPDSGCVGLPVDLAVLVGDSAGIGCWL